MHITAVCKRVRRNNGTVQVLFMRQSDYSDANSQEAHVLINILSTEQQFQEDKTYSIDIKETI